MVPSSSLARSQEEEIARFEKRIQEMPAISTLLESEDHIEALLKAIYGDEAYKRYPKKRSVSNVTVAMNALWTLLLAFQSSDLQEMKEEDHGAEITCQFCQTTYNFDENDLEDSFVTNLNTPFMIGNVEIPQSYRFSTHGWCD